MVTFPDSFMNFEKYFLSENGMRKKVPAINNTPISATSRLKVEHTNHIKTPLNKGCPKVKIRTFPLIGIFKFSTNENRSVPRVG